MKTVTVNGVEMGQAAVRKMFTEKVGTEPKYVAVDANSIRVWTTVPVDATPFSTAVSPVAVETKVVRTYNRKTVVPVTSDQTTVS